MKSRLLVALVSVSALGALAFAGASHHFALTEPTQFTRELVFPGYDSADGPLRGVALCIRWKHKRDILCESLDSQSSVVSSQYTPAIVNLELNGTSLATLTFAPLQRVDTLSAFDGTLDFQGTSAFQARTSTHGNQLIIFEDPAILAAFIDVPSVTITVRGQDIFSIFGPGNLVSEAATQFQLEGFLIYGGA